MFTFISWIPPQIRCFLTLCVLDNLLPPHIANKTYPKGTMTRNMEVYVERLHLPRASLPSRPLMMTRPLALVLFSHTLFSCVCVCQRPDPDPPLSVLMGSYNTAQEMRKCASGPCVCVSVCERTPSSVEQLCVSSSPGTKADTSAFCHAGVKATFLGGSSGQGLPPAQNACQAVCKRACAYTCVFFFFFFFFACILPPLGGGALLLLIWVVGGGRWGSHGPEPER